MPLPPLEAPPRQSAPIDERARLLADFFNGEVIPYRGEDGEDEVA
ncbi:MAG: hypothetical protein ACK5FE_01235 [Cyanobacteriota bacterium]